MHESVDGAGIGLRLQKLEKGGKRGPFPAVFGIKKLTGRLEPAGRPILKTYKLHKFDRYIINLCNAGLYMDSVAYAGGS